MIHTDDFASPENPVLWWPRLIKEALEPIARGAPSISYVRTSWGPGHPTFNDRQLGTIQPNEIREWVADLEDREYSPATIAKAFQIVSRCFRVAVSDGLIPRTPCREIKLPTNDRDERRFLSPTEVEQLAAAMKNRYRLVVLTGAYTGLRFGELAALRLDDLDLLRRTLRVDEQLSRQGSSRMTPGPLKSKKAYRTIGIPTFLAEDLAAHLSAFPSSTDFVFSHESGGPLDYGRFRRRHWHPAVEVSIGEPCTPHDLRHTHVAMLIADGQSPRYIADRLGHKSTRTVLDVYGHLYEDADEAVMEGLERLRGAAQTDTRRTPGDLTRPRCGQKSGLTRALTLWALTDSNRRPLPCKGSALAN